MTAKRIVVTLVVLGVLAAALVSCGGSTRFVVVDNNGAPAASTPASSAPDPTSDSTSDSTPGSTPGTTAASAEPAPASAKEATAIKKAIQTALVLTNIPMEERLEGLDGGEDLGPTFEAVYKVVKDLDVKLVVGNITVTGDQATATTSVEVDGSPFAKDLPVTLVRKDDEWLVTRAGACTLLALASPCPEA